MSQDELLNTAGEDRPIEILELPNGSLRVITLWDLYKFSKGNIPSPYPFCSYKILAKDNTRYL